MGQQPDVVDEKKEAGVAMGGYDEEQYNRYLLDASGPKTRTLNFNSVEDQDMVSYADEEAVDGAYRMQHKGEKFSLTRVTKTDQEDEADVKKR